MLTTLVNGLVGRGEAATASTDGAPGVIATGHQGLTIVAAAAFIALIAIVERRIRHWHLARSPWIRRRIESAVWLAERDGWQLDVGPTPLPASLHRFWLYLGYKNREMWFVLSRAGVDDFVFDHCEPGATGIDPSVIRPTCAVVRLPFDAPHMTIEPEGTAAGIVRSLGIRDIEVESTSFNDAFQVRGADRRFAITLLDQPMMAWLLSEHRMSRRSIELGGRWLICSTARLEVDERREFLEWTQALRDRLPAVLESLYPVR